MSCSRWCWWDPRDIAALGLRELLYLLAEAGVHAQKYDSSSAAFAKLVLIQGCWKDEHLEKILGP